jgi:hypothetical protein
METVRIRDGKKSDPGSGINIPDPPHWLNCRKTVPGQILKSSDRVLYRSVGENKTFPPPLSAVGIVK